MSRVNPVPIEDAKGDLRNIYQNLTQKTGKVINIFQNMGNSPPTLKAFLALNDASNHISLSPQLREQLALTVSQSNHCNYCLAAHTLLAKGAGLNENDILKARQGESQDPKNQAILKFAKLVVENKGHVSNQDVASLKASGVNDTELVEIIFVIIVNMFTNYFNLITDPKIDLSP